MLNSRLTINQLSNSIIILCNSKYLSLYAHMMSRGTRQVEIIKLKVSNRVLIHKKNYAAYLASLMLRCWCAPKRNLCVKFMP